MKVYKSIEIPHTSKNKELYLSWEDMLHGKLKISEMKDYFGEKYAFAIIARIYLIRWLISFLLLGLISIICGISYRSR
jgi:hypothetical protein